MVLHCTGSVVDDSCDAFDTFSASGINLLITVSLFVFEVVRGTARRGADYSSVSILVYGVPCGHFEFCIIFLTRCYVSLRIFEFTCIASFAGT